MPTGVYHRSPKLMEQVRKNLTKGRTPKVRKKVAQKMRAMSQTKEWREKVSRGTKKAMRKPEIRKKHLQGLSKAFGYNYGQTTSTAIPKGLTNTILAEEYHQRLWSRIKTGKPHQCWLFTGNRTTGGYGVFWSGEEEFLAHRLVLMLKLGRFITKEELACHTCDNPPCCNPDHLYLGNPQDNVDDKMLRGRWKSREKLERNQVKEIKKIFKLRT